jgi:cytosine/creatinine deaminase
MTLNIINARLSDRPDLCDITLTDGIITEISSVLEVPAHPAIDAQGNLVIPGLIDAHFHLDKALLLDRCPAQAGDFAEALRETSRLKQEFTPEDIQARASRAIESAIGFGITAMRSHVEVDSSVGLMGMEALLPLRSRYQDLITLQLAVFAQEGITNQPGIEALLRKAMAIGGDAIGSAPYVDPDPEQNVRIVFDIAQEFDRDVDFHLDFLDNDEPLLLPFVIAETIRRGWQGRVCVGHLTKLAGLLPEELRAIAPQIRDAGISVLALPASDLYMMGRKDSHNVRRGVAPVHQLAEFGVTVGLATNNVQNLFTPFGDGDVLKLCTLLAQVLQLGTIAQHQRCLDMATTLAAKAIGIENHSIAVGNPADLVILEAKSVSQAIGTAPVGRTVIKQGKAIVQTQIVQTKLDLRGLKTSEV